MDDSLDIKIVSSKERPMCEGTVVQATKDLRSR
jgi:hypothetical protein